MLVITKQPRSLWIRLPSGHVDLRGRQLPAAVEPKPSTAGLKKRLQQFGATAGQDAAANFHFVV
jgi:hypothetical protein